ncbi:MAG: ribosome-associated translation inhibitor RaiA [Aeriscardovia sp.]|nr:ribosome-associated translation inhibitor RaiA [Aeriscardovia sp.]
MEVEITARRVQLSKKFKEEVDAKLGKVTKIAPDAQSAHIVVTAQPNPSMASDSRKVEITVFAGKDCIRADSASDQDVAAFDEALDKLMERMRRFRGKRRGLRTHAAAVPEIALEPPASPSAVQDSKNDPEKVEAKIKNDEHPEELVEARLGDAVFEVRRKIHEAQPMDINEAIYEMELLGHDFFLFVDKETGNPSVLYRRHGMSYGMLELKNN